MYKKLVVMLRGTTEERYKIISGASNVDITRKTNLYLTDQGSSKKQLNYFMKMVKAGGRIHKCYTALGISRPTTIAVELRDIINLSSKDFEDALSFMSTKFNKQAILNSLNYAAQNNMQSGREDQSMYIMDVDDEVLEGKAEEYINYEDGLDEKTFDLFCYDRDLACIRVSPNEFI
jgi:hypothetical protein